MTPPDDPLRSRLLHALKANAYRGGWYSDHSTMIPLEWDADDVVDRIIEDAALAQPARSEFGTHCETCAECDCTHRSGIFALRPSGETE